MTLQTIPNGSSHYYMIDVGETQIVLNTWGTLHATGYPHYVITGNILTDFLTFTGVDSAAAPGMVSMLWGMLALVLLYQLAVHLAGNRLLALLTVLLFGLTRTVWIHLVIAEIYSFGLLILAALLLLALWRDPIPSRLYWMALLGGIGVAHHRAFVMAIPALVYAVLPEFLAPGGRGRDTTCRVPTNILRTIRVVSVCLLLGLLGFLPYIYLYFRAQAGADWVYGEPGTLQGLWDQFTGTEASRFIGLADSFSALVDNFNLINAVLVRDLTLPGIIVGIIGLAVVIFQKRADTHLRRAAITLSLSAAAAYGFHVLFYSDVLSALILPITLSLVFGWLFLTHKFAVVLTFISTGEACLAPTRFVNTGAAALPLAVGLVLAAYLVTTNYPFIKELTTDRTGLETIEQAAQAPSGSTLMIAWGPRHFAVGFARDVEHDPRLQAVNLVDHKADFARLVRETKLITPEYTFYNQPVNWWEVRTGTPVYLRAAGPYLVEIGKSPRITETSEADVHAVEESITCTGEQLILNVTWQAGAESPSQDRSVFVHVVDSSGTIIAQGDQFAPVYGWRPLTTWLPGEQVRDIYPVGLDDPAQAASVRYGLYRALPEGGFENTLERELPVACG